MRSETPIVTLAHGDGGDITLSFIRDEILSRFGNPILNKLEDGGWAPINSTHIVISTDSYIVDPPIFPGGDIGKLAISGTVNDLLASGAIPYYLTFSLILPEGFPLFKLRQILDSAQHTAQSVGIEIIAGDTKVLGKKANGGIYINTTGIGLPIWPDRDYAVSNACVGDNIIITGSIGDHGLAVLSAREGLGFEQRVQSDCAPLHELIIPLLKTVDGLHCLRDPTRGGLAGVLVDIAESSKVDLLIYEDSIPIKEEVRFGCEMLGIEPISLLNEGKMVIVVAPEETNKTLTKLRDHPLGRESMVIGTAQHLHLRSSIGLVTLNNGYVNRLVERPRSQSLPRLC
jgi:hydrogenase expression/formation protein HypE